MDIRPDAKLVNLTVNGGDGATYTDITFDSGDIPDGLESVDLRYQRFWTLIIVFDSFEHRN